METSQEKIDLFNKYLVDFQDDISRIVSRYRKPHHPYSAEELISDVNISLIKKSEKLISSEESVLSSFNNFKKVAYAFCKNSVIWSHKGSTYETKKYLENRSDTLIKDSEGDLKSLFEFVCDSVGEEDENFLKLNESDKFQTIMKWVFDYSHFLSPNQKNILQFVLSGKKQPEIAEITGTTNQAVSDALINAYRKIQSNIKIDVFSDSSDGDKMAEGLESVKYIFGQDRTSNRKMSPDFCRKIKKLLEGNPKKYTLDDLCEITGKKHSKKQICVIINNSKHCQFLKI
jgi:RNA polymerase sigma factor (sigma-70 family)